MQPLYINTKVTFVDLYGYNFIMYNIYENQLINECSRKNLTKIPEYWNLVVRKVLIDNIYSAFNCLFS